MQYGLFYWNRQAKEPAGLKGWTWLVFTAFLPVLSRVTSIWAPISFLLVAPLLLTCFLLADSFLLAGSSSEEAEDELLFLAAALLLFFLAVFLFLVFD